MKVKRNLNVLINAQLGKLKKKQHKTADVTCTKHFYTFMPPVVNIHNQARLSPSEMNIAHLIYP